MADHDFMRKRGSWADTLVIYVVLCYCGISRDLRLCICSIWTDESTTTAEYMAVPLLGHFGGLMVPDYGCCIHHNVFGEYWLGDYAITPYHSRRVIGTSRSASDPVNPRKAMDIGYLRRCPKSSYTVNRSLGIRLQCKLTSVSGCAT